MNLINCNENCIHQKDGYCILENPVPVSSVDRDCCFYENKKILPRMTGQNSDINHTS